LVITLVITGKKQDIDIDIDKDIDKDIDIDKRVIKNNSLRGLYWGGWLGTVYTRNWDLSRGWAGDLQFVYKRGLGTGTGYRDWGVV